MKSQSNSQELNLDNILLVYGNIFKAMTEQGADFRHRIEHEKGKEALLNLALSCLPEKRGKLMWQGKMILPEQEVGFNAAIDTMEGNINLKFGGSDVTNI